MLGQQLCKSENNVCHILMLFDSLPKAKGIYAMVMACVCVWRQLAWTSNLVRW